MKIFKNKGFITLFIVLFIFIAGTITYRLIQNENKLTVTEKSYINKNRSNLITVNVLNNINVFGDAGTGVFYDFLNDFTEERELSFNKIAIQKDNTSSGLTLSKGNSLPKNSKLFYIDHFVLVSKKYEIVELEKINGQIGITTKNESTIKKYIPENIEFKVYDNASSLIEGFEAKEIDYILVPEIEYLDTILNNLYHIVYHYSDIKEYYYMSASDDNILTSILSKYYNVWIKEKFEESFNKNEYSLFTSSLKITEKELDIIDNKEYNYGFINYAPYNIKTNTSFGGITASYLDKFSKFSGITFNYNKYRNKKALKKAIDNKKIDLFLNNNYIVSNYIQIDSQYKIELSIVMANKDGRVFKSLDSLKNYYIYVKEDTKAYEYLKNLGYNIKTYDSDSSLNKIFKNNGIVAMDSMSYLVYRDKNNNVNERFKVDTNITYNFMSNNDSMFNRLFYYYTTSLDPAQIKYTGLENYNSAKNTGTLVYNITKYAVLLILLICLVGYLIYKYGHRTFVRKKIKKADKMKYIDLLTSLKNRNFLTENMSVWNQNTIYPQAIIVVDLNGIQELNDSYGYQEGDKQIKALANILIKTQLDNTEIMRTDGNEFTIYMVGYNEKQVISYIKKLLKEFKNLPHDNLGAAVGFSMIEDDIKLIDDAINEATENMKKDKHPHVEEDNNEKAI